PAAAVHDVLEECGRKGVKGAVIITAGFSEVSEDGAAREADVLSSARRGGMRIVGPNCMGVLNTDAAISLDGQFGPTFPPRGNVAIASQSGALGLAILEQTAEMNIGVSTFVSLGNGKDISASDLLLYWEDDPATDVIVMYMESFGNPRRFGRLARRVGRSKPVVVVKSGRSSAGARAAASHTGSLASVDVAVDALFARAGVIRTDTLHQLFDLTELLAHQPLPRGRRVAVLSNAGGPGILAADALEGSGLELPELSPALQAKLGKHLPGIAAPQNPVDMIASAGPQQYRACLQLLLASDEIDVVIVIYIPPAPEGTEEVIAAIHEAVAAQESPKTTIAVLMGSSHAAEVAGSAVKLPVYPYPESAARALSAAVQYREWREKPEGEVVRFTDIDTAAGEAAVHGAIQRLGSEGGWLDSAEIEQLLDAYGIRSARSSTMHDEDEAVRVAADVGKPVVLKVIAPSALHKSDVGGVVLDVSGEQAVRAAYEQVTSAVADATGVLVQEFVSGGHEVIIGMTEDPVFGPLVVYGLGGIFVELMRDVAFRINPLTDLDAAEMLAEVKSARLLTGYRGTASGDLEALQELLLRVSALVEGHPQIAEIDLNPVKVLPPGDGAIVVDARMRLQPVGGLLPASRKDIPGRLL
ncbi:MAG: acetate--CoA ligase family protein, partial [Planctomycetota bacterium]